MKKCRCITVVLLENSGGHVGLYCFVHQSCLKTCKAIYWTQKWAVLELWALHLLWLFINLLPVHLLDINHNFPIELQIYSLVKWALILRIDGSLKQYINYTCTSCKYMTMIWCVTIDLIVIGCSINWAYSFYSWPRQHHPRQVYDRHP